MATERLQRFSVACGCMLACLWSSAALATTVCGDPLEQGHVSVTAGVIVLAEAAGLPSACRPPICDVNLDGHVSISDGVLTLRLAAELPAPEFTCGIREVPRQIDRFGPITKGGGGATTSGFFVRSAGAPTSTPCPNGGRTEVRDDGFQDFVCDEGRGVVTDGFVAIADRPGTNGVDVTFDGYVVQQNATDNDERIVLSGGLFFTQAPGGTDFAVVGSIDDASSVLGDFTDHYDVVVSNTAPTEGSILAGTIRTEVARGTGPYAHLVTLETELFATGLRVAHLTFADGATQAFVIGGASPLCMPCTADPACGNGLTCRTCATECTNTTQRCAVGDPLANCIDGNF